MSHNDPITKDEAAKKAAARQSRSISPQTATQSPTKKTNLNPRHTTNPPDSCLSRSFMIGAVSAGRGGAKRALAAPPGGRLWHGSAVRRPPVGRGGRGLTFGLIGGGGLPG